MSIGAALVVLLLLMVAANVGAGHTSVDTVNDHFQSYLYQPTKGDLDYEVPHRREVWNSGRENVSTEVLCLDLDDNGVKELVFGTDRGRLVAVEMGTWIELVKEKVTDQEIFSLRAGNLDDDEETELVMAAGDGVHCYDMTREKVTWIKPYETFDGMVQLVPARTEPGEEERSDVLFLRMKGTVLAGTEHYVTRLDGEGAELYKTQLPEVEGRPALRSSWVVEDMDRDGDLEVFVSDRGKAGIGASGLGKNIWLVEASNGTVTDTWTIRHATLASRPMLVVSEGAKSVAVGMDQGLGSADNNDMLLWDGEDHSLRYLDVYDNSDVVSWQHIDFIPDATSGMVVLTSSNWNMHAFHLVNQDVSWSHQYTLGGLSANPATCDIDGDGDVEVLCPAGGLSFIDAMTGAVEGRVEPEKGTAINIALTLADVDDDDVTETVLGHYDTSGVGKYRLEVLGHIKVPEPEPTANPMWGWALIIFILVANVVLFADLWRHWKRPREEED